MSIFLSSHLCYQWNVKAADNLRVWETLGRCFLLTKMYLPENCGIHHYLYEYCCQACYYFHNNHSIRKMVYYQRLQCWVTRTRARTRTCCAEWIPEVTHFHFLTTLMRPPANANKPLLFSFNVSTRRTLQHKHKQTSLIRGARACKARAEALGRPEENMHNN